MAGQTLLKNIGTVEQVKDGIVLFSGFSQSKMSEKIQKTDGSMTGMVLNLADDSVGAIVFGDYSLIKEGDTFETTGEIMSISVSEQLLGRAVDALGEPIDGKGEIEGVSDIPVERIASGVMDRQPVTEPLQTGVLAVDAMIPIGRGQRELVIGDRGTGKTAFTIDTIINQKDNESPVICIYVAIGQKQARVAQLIEKLETHGAMDYSIVMSAPASDSVAMQYIAPYSATAIGEYFMEQGKDVLIIYDDLTKHAWAYRQISLVLERPPGREAYPGDIFYLHSKLLERSCRLNEELGGGSITSLPIVETQLSDVSAYIPTNIISITDGQVYFETDLFNSGIRPAIDPGNSVSRVGGAAQKKAMKKVAGKMRLDLAQFKELEAFAQFGSADLDAQTRNRIERGRRIRELLKQPQYKPLPVQTQIAIIYAVNNGCFDTISLEDIQEEKEKFMLYMHANADEDYEKVVDNYFGN